MINRVAFSDVLISVTRILDRSHIGEEGLILVHWVEAWAWGCLLSTAAGVCSDVLRLGGSGCREVWLEPEADLTFKDWSPLPVAKGSVTSPNSTVSWGP